MNPLAITTVTGLISKGLDILFPDPAVAAQHKIDLLKLQKEGMLEELDAELKGQLAQLEVNKIEAASDNIFKSGWRPAFGWVGVFALASQYIVRPFAPWLMEVFGVYVPPIPSIDMEALWPLIFGLLGLGGLRSWDKRRP